MEKWPSGLRQLSTKQPNRKVPKVRIFLFPPVRKYFKSKKDSVYYLLEIWGCSSAGRAVPLQGTGRRFDSCRLHQPTEREIKCLKH